MHGPFKLIYNILNQQKIIFWRDCRFEPMTSPQKSYFGEIVVLNPWPPPPLTNTLTNTPRVPFVKACRLLFFKVCLKWVFYPQYGVLPFQPIFKPISISLYAFQTIYLLYFRFWFVFNKDVLFYGILTIFSSIFKWILSLLLWD